MDVCMKVLVSLSDELFARMQAVIPPRQRSKVVAELLEEEVRRRERELYECALAVEQDEQLQSEMADWDVTVGDGIETETW
jgi:metal-responsive CopG/Arc/MetJ family transcriptional regulator